MPKVWVNGSDTWTPSADTALVTVTVPEGRIGKIYGWFILSSEANQFYLQIGTTFYRIAVLTAGGDKLVISNEPLFDNIAAGTEISIRNVNAGGAAQVYRAGILVRHVKPE